MTRLYLSAERLARLESRLSPLDQAIANSLARVRVATAGQLGRLHFHRHGLRHRRAVLASLADRRIVVRLERQVGGVRAGSSGHVYALDVAGQRLANRLGPAGGLRVERPWTPGLAYLAHSLAVAELYVRVVEAERAGDLELLGFAAEPATWRTFVGQGGARQTLKPDAALLLGLGEFEDRWLIEVDRATESPAALAAKLRVYRAYWQSGNEQAITGGVFPRVLWLVPDAQRVAELAAVIARHPEPARTLHSVALFDDALVRLAQGAAA